MTKKDGGPAFPNEYDYIPGMTLRDWFAGQALAGLWTDDSAVAMSRSCSVVMAEDCYQMADAMLAEREKGDNDG